MKAVRVEDVHYAYDDGTRALEGLSFEVEMGEKVAILGPNGAGKSTLLLILMGLLTPQSGKVYIQGREMNGKTAAELRRHIGLVFQDPDDQLFMPRVWDDVAFGPMNMQLSEEEVSQRVREALRSTGMSGYEDRMPHRLSQGEKKRIAIAGVLAMDPEILLLDEPTSDLDPAARSQLIELLKGLDQTVLIATHDIEAAIQTTQRAVVINKKKLAEGPYSEIFADEEVLRLSKLRPPALQGLFLDLRRRGLDVKVPLTREEALESLRSLLRPGEKDSPRR